MSSLQIAVNIHKTGANPRDGKEEEGSSLSTKLVVSMCGILINNVREVKRMPPITVNVLLLDLFLQIMV